MAQATINNLPVYEATISNDNAGMKKISLVSRPAVETDFLAFDAQAPAQRFAVEDEEKRLIFGVIMRADYPIYRLSRDGKGDGYYITFSKEVVREMAEKYLAEGRSGNINLQHADGSDVEGVNMTQYFIKDSNAGINPAQFANIEEGSLFAEFHVTNDEVWEGVKNGDFKGFSLEGLFSEVPVSASAEQLREALCDILAQYVANPNKTKEDMTLIERMRAALSETPAPTTETKLGSVATKNGTLLWEGDDVEISVDLNVYTEDSDGNHTPAADGEYATEDGKVIVVADGKVSEIKDAETDDNKDGDDNANKEQTMSEKIAQKFASIREAFGYSIDDLYSKVYALLPDSENMHRFIAELGSDYVVMLESVADGEEWSEHYMRYPINVSEDGEVSLAGDPVEVVLVWEPKDKPTDTPKDEPDNNGGEGNDEAMQQMQAEIDALKAENERLLALSKQSQGKSAHQAYNETGKQDEAETNMAEEALTFARKNRR